MIYVDTSVVLAELFAEDRCPPPTFWDEELASSRLVEYEIWNAIHRQRAERSHGEAARRIIESLAMSTLLFLRELGVEISLASYDRRMREAAAALGIELADC
jgi:predicted nucleic acid-binding protein